MADSQTQHDARPAEEAALPADEVSQAGYEPLFSALGYRFEDLGLLRRAMTHRSHVNEQDEEERHNERLEFLGDAVVGLCAAQELMTSVPEAREGRLTKLRAMVVSEQGLAAAAAALGLGDYLRLGRGEEQGGGRDKASILSDSFEALVGAIYLDGGFEAVQQVVRRQLAGLFTAAVSGEIDRDFKTRLQERIAARSGEALRYEVVAESGPDHAKSFEVAALLGGRELARAVGHSKKEAEQQAACLALEALEASDSDGS